jgi:hypothetical protein
MLTMHAGATDRGARTYSMAVDGNRAHRLREAPSFLGSGGLLLLLCAAAFAPQRVHALETKPDTTLSDGLSLSVGVGTQYASLGLQAAYALQLRGTWFRAVGHVALGMALNIATQFEARPGPVVGVTGSWGRKHRPYIDASFGLLGLQRISLHGEPAGITTLWGPSVSVGYEYMTYGGFFVRLDVGAGYVINVPILSPQGRLVFTFTLFGVGWKLW